MNVKTKIKITNKIIFGNAGNFLEIILIKYSIVNIIFCRQLHAARYLSQTIHDRKSISLF